MPSGAVLASAKTELETSDLPADANAPLFLDIRFHDLQPGTPPPDEGRLDVRADLCLEFGFFGDSVQASVFYNESLFTERTATRVLNYLKATFQSMQSDASTIVAAIGLFSREEQAWFETHCRAKPLQFPRKFVHEEIAGQAAKNPDKVAVRFNEEHLTYQELNGRANQLARYFRRRGVPSEGRVLVCLEPSLEVAVVLLAILKAGATYVPVNPSHPEFRIRAIVEDTRPDLIITQTRIRELVSQFGVELLEAGNLPRTVREESTGDLSVDIQSRQIAYIYYTSGTTGQPKGVAASHANMIHFVNVARHRYRISADDVIPAVASFTFSISMFELTAALSVGGTLLILERRHVLDVERMAATLQQVTLFHIGPSLLKNIVKYIKQNVTDYGVFAMVRHASSGGDMVPAELLRDLQRIFSSSELYVIYGCSEISLMGCTWELPRERVKMTLVGKPFRNVHLLVLDDDDNQVPPGAIGDVCFGGPGVVGGYVNNREKTHALFFMRDGDRFYRTGDRGRLNANGELELLGRRDFQIKVRGMRVELAEIEHHLRQAKGVRDGLVAAKPHSSGEMVLVAYYVPEGGKALQHKELHAHMAARLPDYMVPVFFVELEALPLNYNLKVDRKALPDLVPEQVSARNPPVTTTEHAIARIWCDLLHVDGVSLDDNFMLLGGDSLLAMEMILLVDRALNFKLDGMDVLRESLWILARLVDSGTGVLASDADVADEPVARDILPVTSFHFGPDDSLYGLYSPARGKGASVPVLICPPIGYEYLRCQFLLRNLAERLAESGVPSLRFDFFASGDSLGMDTEASFERWQQDLRTGFDELKRQTGCDRARVFGLRLTSVLALKALPHDEIDRWVLWDPAIDGALYYRELRRMSKEKAHKLLVKRNLKRPARIPGAEELVGTRFSTESVESLKALSLR
ncbi:MAG: amino acid adenylation domain-containing protein, partial [Woeseiaceae bacterium]